MNEKTRTLTLSAMLCAVAYLLTMVGRIPITSVDFLKYDPKDVILALGGFIMGPMQAFLMSVVVSLVEMVTISDTGIIGCFMNVLSTCAFVCTAATIYRRHRTLKGAVVGLGIGALLMTGVMLLWNYCITPIYMGYPRQAVAAMLLPVFLPFNLVKSIINAALTMLLYQPVKTALRRTPLLQSAPAGTPKGKLTPGVAVVSLVVLASCIVAAMALRGIL